MMQQRGKKGFTLIELLIVIVIIGIVSGVAVISIGSNQEKKIETLAKQFVKLIQLAEQEALLRPVTLGLLIEEREFKFYEYQLNNISKKYEWIASSQSIFKSRVIPNKIQMILKSNKQSLLDSKIPQIIISPSGNISPFMVLFGKINDSPSYRVIGEPNGEIRSEVVNEK